MSAAADSAGATAASATAVGAATDSASAAANNTAAAAAAHTGVKHVRGGVHLAGVMVIVIVIVVVVVVVVLIIIIVVIVVVIVIIIVVVVCSAVAGVTSMGAVRRLGVMTVTGADSSIDIGVARGQGGGERGGNETRQQKDKSANTNHDEWID